MDVAYYVVTLLAHASTISLFNRLDDLRRLRLIIGRWRELVTAIIPGVTEGAPSPTAGSDGPAH